jgi:hypothetical protein
MKRSAFSDQLSAFPGWQFESFKAFICYEISELKATNSLSSFADG